MTYTPNNKTITDLIEWALEHGYNPYTSITSLPERRDRLYWAYLSVIDHDALSREREVSKTYADRSQDLSLPRTFHVRSGSLSHAR